MTTCIKSIYIFFIISSLIFSQNNAAFFDGIDDYAAPLTNNASGLSEGTIEMWFKPVGWTSTNVVFNGGNGHPGVTGDLLRIGSHSSAGSGPLSFGFYSGGWVWSNSQSTPQLGQWLM